VKYLSGPLCECVSLSVFFCFVFVATQSLNSSENNILSVELAQVPTVEFIILYVNNLKGRAFVPSAACLLCEKDR
jgi:hypothetical protein